LAKSRNGPAVSSGASGRVSVQVKVIGLIRHFPGSMLQ
jgi:hypothetical protein